MLEYKYSLIKCQVILGVEATQIATADMKFVNNLYFIFHDMYVKMCQYLQPIWSKFAYIVPILRCYWFDLFDVCPNQSAEHLIDEVPKKVEDKLKDLEEIAEGDAKPEWETTSQGVDQTSVPYSVVNLVLYNMLVKCVKEDVDLDQGLCWILATVAVRAGGSCLKQKIQNYPWYGIVSKIRLQKLWLMRILDALASLDFKS